MKKVLSLFLVVLMLVGMLPMTMINASAADQEVTFTLGANGSASHYDGSEKTAYSETVEGYTLSITGGTKMYTGARDAKGNSCIKLGTSSAVGGFKFTVPTEVTSVVIYVAKYKANTTKFSVNGTTHTLTKSSNDGAYDEITVDTSSSKTVTVTTVSGGVRAMVNNIKYVIGEAGCAHANQTTTTEAASCTEAGSTIITCDDCEAELSNEVIPATGHNYVDGACANCGTALPDAVATLITSAGQFVSGEYVMVVSKGYAMGQFEGGWILPVEPVITGNDVNDAAGGIWTLTVDGTSVAIVDANGKAVGPKTGDVNGIENKEYSWAWTCNDDGTFTFKGTGTDSTTLACNLDATNGQNRFRAYKNTTVTGDQKANYLTNFSLYKVITDDVVCDEHNYENGYCTNCGAKDETNIDKPDCTHEWSYEETPASCTVAGVKTGTCALCGATTTETLPAVGSHSFGEDGNCANCGMTPAQVVEAAYALGVDEYLPGEYTLTGKIISIDTPFNSSYGNVTVTMVVGDMTDKPIKCYRLAGTGADVIQVNYTITVTGKIQNYYGNTVEFTQGCQLVSYSEPPCEHTETTTTTVEATCVLTGSVTETCNSCGIVVDKTVIDKIEHSFEEGVCATCSMVDAPATCTAFKWAIAQDNLGKILYFAGTMNGYYGATTENIDEAVSVSLEEIEEGYYIRFIDANGAKKYINVVVSDTHKNFTIADEAVTVYEWDYDYNTLVTNVEGTICFLGTYNTYNTFSVSSVENITTNFPAYLVSGYFAGGHDLTYVEAVVPANCSETGHSEYWECVDCGLVFGDAEGSWEVNPAWINYTGEHVRPEDAAPCAVVACTLCGEESYGTDPCDRGDAPACQEATCVNCGGEMWGEGHSYGYDEETWEPLAPFCQPGDCIYCGEHLDYIYECENGSYAACSVDGECVHGCGKQFPATGIHDLLDPCAGGLCWMCWEEIEGAHNYVDGACSNCGEADPSVPSIPVAEDLVFTQTGLSFQEFIGIQPVMKNSVATSYDEVYIEVVHTAWDKDQGGFVTTTENIYGSTYAKTYYRFTKKIMAWSMSEIVTITLYGRKGDTLYVGQSVTTSVEQLALTKLAEYEGKGNTKACTALASMLTYGAKLQIVQNFNTENLADANLGAYSKYVAETTPTINKTNDLGTATAVKVNVNNVSMQAQVELQVAFKQSTDLTGYELRYTVGGVTYTMPVSEFSELSGYNFAKIAVKASNMREIYTIALYDIATDKPVTAVLNVSVEGYCTKKLTTADAANTALMYALINYGDAIAAL